MDRSDKFYVVSLPALITVLKHWYWSDENFVKLYDGQSIHVSKMV